jgi:hypothetical protein
MSKLTGFLACPGLLLLLLAPLPVWCQAPSEANGGTNAELSGGAPSPGQVPPEASGGTMPESPMAIPPIVNAEPFPTTTLSEKLVNGLFGTVSFKPAYDDNVVPNDRDRPVADESYTLGSGLWFNTTGPRFHQNLSYTPGFTFFQRVTERNDAYQHAMLNTQYLWTPHIAISLRDAFAQSGNAFDQYAPGVPISGAPTPYSFLTGAIYAPLISNNATGEATYQFAKASMIGGGGGTNFYDYTDPALNPGIYNSNSRNGSGFYSHRISEAGYLGATYQYGKVLAFPSSGLVTTHMDTILAFYADQSAVGPIVSVAFGPQYYDVAEPGLPKSGAWTPMFMGSLGWQTEHANLVASYSRQVTGGGGLAGDYHSNSVHVLGEWRMTRIWTVSGSATYERVNSVLPLPHIFAPGGTTIIGMGSIERPLGGNLRARFVYQRFHLSYPGLAAVANDPDADQVSVDISYWFNHELGR